MNLYELLGVDPKADASTIKKAHKKAVSKNHPDKGGDPEKFREVQEAFEVLSDPERRKRYDTTGRKDKSPLTEKRVRDFIEQTIRKVVEAEAPNGNQLDDPTTEDIKSKVVMGLKTAQGATKQMKFKTQRRIERTQRLLERFKPNKTGVDFVGDCLRAEKKRLWDELRGHEDALELLVEVERVFMTYGYEVGPEPEGQVSPGPTARRGGLLYIR